MKYASFDGPNGSSYGVVQGDHLVEASKSFRLQYPTLKDVLANNALDSIETDPSAIALKDVHLLPPVPNAGKVICVGINYEKKYPVEGAPPPLPDHIILFAKQEGTLIGHEDMLEYPAGEAADTFDYEGEIAIIIGKPGRHISRHSAMDHVAGYTIVNDGSVRAWQKHSLHAGKNFNRCGGCGPWMVTPDEMPKPDRMELTTRLNGNTVQHTTASKMIFPIDEVISYISQFQQLNPGDIIATGSPEGAGGSFDPPRFLKAGDRLEMEVTGIGVLANTVGSRD
ncbi:MAG: fumarylacetoacetate hydrolase family protein [Anderseniella sp.]